MHTTLQTSVDILRHMVKKNKENLTYAQNILDSCTFIAEYTPSKTLKLLIIYRI